MKLIHMIAPTIIIIMIITLPQVRVEAADLLMVKVGTDNLEASHNEIEVKDLNIVNVNFRTIDFREADSNNRTQYSNNRKPYFQGNQTNSYRGRGRGQGPQQFRGCGHGRANYQSSNGVYQYYTHDPQTEQYGPPCSLCGSFNHSPKHCYKGEHDISNIMEKMSINPHHQQQQSNLYQ